MTVLQLFKALPFEEMDLCKISHLTEMPMCSVIKEINDIIDVYIIKTDSGYKLKNPNPQLPN